MPIIGYFRYFFETFWVKKPYKYPAYTVLFINDVFLLKT